MKKTHHSEYLRLETLYLKSAESSFYSEKQLSNQWEELQFISKPNFNESLKEYEKFQLFLANKNIELSFFPEDKKTWIDSIYCRDASIATDFGMIMCIWGRREEFMSLKHN